jgi:hypothetical protein
MYRSSASSRTACFCSADNALRVPYAVGLHQ